MKVSPVRPILPGYGAAIVTGVLAILASLTASWFVLSWEYRVADLEFQNKARGFVQIINADLTDATTLLYTLAAYFDSRDHPIAQDEFERFSKVLHERAVGLRDVGWAPHVTRSGRSDFERAARLRDAHNYRIWERDARGERHDARDRAQYYPIVFVEPRKVKGRVAGFDLLSEPIRAKAIALALTTRRPSATPPIRLITVRRSAGGVMAFMPVEDRLTPARGGVYRAKGLIFGVFELVPMIENIITKKTLASGLDVYLYDPNGMPAKRMIYWRPSSVRLGPDPTEAAQLALVHWQGAVSMIDQRWQMIVTPTEPLSLFRWSWRAVAALVLSFTMSAMIVAYLAISLQRRVQLETLTTSLNRSTEQLSHMARHDELTGLPNRFLFMERIAEAIARFRRDMPFAILFLDLDRFKAVNDMFGHGTGDQLLCLAAERIAGCLREVDTVSRLGGDEFAIVLTETTGAAIAPIADRLISEVGRPYTLDGHTLNIGLSIGVTIATTENASADALLNEADLALYEAKRAGRGTFRFFEPRLRAERAGRENAPLVTASRSVGS